MKKLIKDMNVPFLSLKDVTAMHGEEIREAARRVIDSGWYLQGKENEAFERHVYRDPSGYHGERVGAGVRGAEPADAGDR